MSRWGTVEDRFWAKVEKTDGCWNWTGAQGAGGYGTIRRPNGGNTPAHRIAYELLVGPIPEGLEIDHLCRNRGCVNPGHLDAVTHAENLRRSPNAIGTVNAAKTHCKRGHLLAGPNLYLRPDGGRQCKACHELARQETLERRAMGAARMNATMVATLALLNERGSLTAAVLADLNIIPRTTASERLRTLAATGLARRVATGQRRCRYDALEVHP